MVKMCFFHDLPLVNLDRPPIINSDKPSYVRLKLLTYCKRIVIGIRGLLSRNRYLGNYASGVTCFDQFDWVSLPTGLMEINIKMSSKYLVVSNHLNGL